MAAMPWATRSSPRLSPATSRSSRPPASARSWSMAAARRSARCSKRLGIKSEFRGGLRVTDKRTVEVVEMVLAGSINKEIVMAINAEGGKAVGLSGKDGNMVFAEKVTRTEIDPDSNIEKVSRPRLRRRAEDGQPRRHRHGARRRADPGDRAGGARRRRRRPTTSTPTPSPAPSPARSARRASSSSPTCPASSTRRASSSRS